MRVISNRRGARFSGLLLLVVFVLFVVLVTGWFVARTDGVRHLLEKKLSDRMGLPVTIGESRIGWPYALVLRDVRSANVPAAGTAGVAVGELRLSRRLLTWNLVLRHVALRVRQDESGVWTPLVAARLADLRQASAMDIVRLTEPVRSRLRLEITDGLVDWLDTEGRTTASLRDVRFRMEPIKLPEQQRMTYYSLRIYAASGGAFGNARDLEWMWLTSNDLAYIELQRLARYDTGVGRTNSLFQAGGGDVD